MDAFAELLMCLQQDLTWSLVPSHKPTANLLDPPIPCLWEVNAESVSNWDIKSSVAPKFIEYKLSSSNHRTAECTKEYTVKSLISDAL